MPMNYGEKSSLRTTAPHECEARPRDAYAAAQWDSPARALSNNSQRLLALSRYGRDHVDIADIHG